MNKTLLIAVIVLSVAFGIPRLLRLWNGPEGNRTTALQRARAQIVYQGLSMHLKPVLTSSKDTPLRVAVGYNSNVDLILDAIALMQKLQEQHPEAIQDLNPQDHIEIKSYKDLFECFLYYFTHAGAVERFIADEQVFQSIVTEGGSFNSSVYHIGGNAALMGLFMHQQNWSVLLSGAIGPKLQQLLEEHQEKEKPQMQFASATSKSGSEDEVHVIMEYAKGASFLNTVTNRANRFIATRDIANAQFLSLKSFHQKLPEFDPHLLVLSGFHLMDGQPKEQREAEFAEITRYLKTVDKIRFVHIELASIGNREIYKEVADNVFPYVTSLGLNEQELAALYNALFPQDIKRNISQTVPDIQQVDHALQKIMQLYPTLSRIHFHSLAYHYVAINKQSGDNWGRTQKQKVESSMAAVAASSLTATQRACGYASFNDIVSNLKNVELIVEMNKLVAQLTSAGKSPNVHNHAIITWTENDLEMFVVPVLVCKQITKTVGLGDAISASGVSAQVKWLVYDIQ